MPGVGEDGVWPPGPYAEAQPRHELGEGVQGLLRPMEPVPTPTALCAKSPSLFHGETLGLNGGLPGLGVRNSIVSQILDVHGPA